LNFEVLLTLLLVVSCDLFGLSVLKQKLNMMKTIRPSSEVSTSSMADIAFLLLTFFLITTVIQNQKGILMILPEFLNKPITTPIHDRNLFTIQINSANEFLIEKEPRKDLTGLKEEVQKFILNNGKDLSSSENPKEAVVSLKTDRGTSYATFIAALDEIQAAYYEIYAERVSITPEQFRKLNPNDPNQLAIYNRGKEGVPMNISIAEPSKIN
jgi:biopolymer transport protein ExbD